MIGGLVMLNTNWELKPEEMTKGQRTQLKIIETAIDLFGEKGFSNVTLQEIAAASDTSHPLILSHFKTKENLLAAIRRFVSHNNHTWVDKEINETDNGFDCVLKHCLENIKWGFFNPSQGKIILLTYYYNSVATDESGVKAIDTGKKRILKYVLQAQREGLIQTTENLEVIAEMIHEYAIGLFTKMLIENPGKNKTKFPPIYKKKLSLFLQSVMSDSQPH